MSNQIFRNYENTFFYYYISFVAIKLCIIFPRTIDKRDAKNSTGF